MATQILMPALSPTMTEGKLAKWLKGVGDEVKAGDVIAEIETDKATMEVEAVDEGKLARILIDEGTAMVWRGPMVMSALTQMMQSRVRNNSGIRAPGLRSAPAPACCPTRR